MRVAIIYPAFGVISPVNLPNLKAVADNYGVYPNMSLAYVAGALQAVGHDLIFLDAMASGYSLNDMIEEVKRFKPKVLMFTLVTYLFHETIDIIKFFRKHCSAKIIVGGAHLRLYPNETLRKKEIDIGIIGEAEETVVELLNALENNKPLSRIKGICYREKNKIILTPKQKNVKNLDKLSFPARNLLPMDKYCSFISKYKNYAILLTSRGCTFQCSFCEQRTGDIRYRSPKNVVDEMKECYNKYNVREIDIFDPLFTINKKRVIEICREIRKRGLKIAWSCRSRVDTINEEMLIEMKKAGCYRIYYGIESGDEQILKNIKKFTKISQIVKAISLTKKHNILSFGYFMFGNPGETIGSIKNTVNLAKKLPLDYAQFSRLSVLPGTSIYNDLRASMAYDYWKEYVKDKSVEKSLPRLLCNLSDEILIKNIKKAYIAFYFRPRFILKTLFKIKSFDEVKRYFQAAIAMIRN